jgi:hypothetical protein
MPEGVNGLGGVLERLLDGVWKEFDRQGSMIDDHEERIRVLEKSEWSSTAKDSARSEGSLVARGWIVIVIAGVTVIINLIFHLIEELGRGK